MSQVSQHESAKRRPPGSLAWRQYQTKLVSGRTVTLGFSLADPDHKTMARLKKAQGASHLGLVIVLGDPDSLEEVVLWFQQATSLTLISQNGDIEIGQEVKGLLARYFAVFFDDIKDIAPELAAVRLAVPKTGDRNLH